jgi:hypothetical protein
MEGILCNLGNFVLTWEERTPAANFPMVWTQTKSTCAWRTCNMCSVCVIFGNPSSTCIAVTLCLYLYSAAGLMLIVELTFWYIGCQDIWVDRIAVGEVSLKPSPKGFWTFSLMQRRLRNPSISQRLQTCYAAESKMSSDMNQLQCNCTCNWNRQVWEPCNSLHPAPVSNFMQKLSQMSQWLSATPHCKGLTQI